MSGRKQGTREEREETERDKKRKVRLINNNSKREGGKGVAED